MLLKFYYLVLDAKLLISHMCACVYIYIVEKAYRNKKFDKLFTPVGVVT